MTKLKYLTVILIAVAGLGLQQAQAHLLPPTQFFHNGPIGNPSDELAFLQSNGFLPATSQYLGKFDRNADNTNHVSNGAINIASFVTVTFAGNVATISWDLTNSGFTLDGLLLKDGNADQQQLYRFYGVSADEALVGSGTVTFDNPVKNISHITFFGSPGGGHVPDGGTTVMLLGAALSTLGVARRYLKS
jgi:hypothetical protein